MRRERILDAAAWLIHWSLLTASVGLVLAGLVTCTYAFGLQVAEEGWTIWRELIIDGCCVALVFAVALVWFWAADRMARSH